MERRTQSILLSLGKLLAILSLVFVAVVHPLESDAAAANKGKPAFELKGTKQLTVGETYTLKIANKPAGATYEWFSFRNAVAEVSQDGDVTAVGKGSVTITCRITHNNQSQVLVAKFNVKEGPMGSGTIQVDKNGFDADGRMVAYFGSPVIDGSVDPIWNKVQAVTPKHVSDNIDTSATFKTLWDDRALYILAEVKDKDISLQSGTPYMQDSVEFFLDENNDKTRQYGVDDIHFRVNVNNALSVDDGDAQRFYTSTRRVSGGYVVEARIALKSKPENGKVMGIELQVNDAKGTERVGTINVFDVTGSAWNNPQQFGEIVLAGKTAGSVSGLNPYDLINLVNSTLRINFSLYKNSNLVTDAVSKVVADSVLNGQKLTQAQLDAHYDAITAAISKLEYTEEAANEKHFKTVPDEYRAASDKPGTIETLHYQTANLENGMDDKKLHVYLPHGYNPADTNKKYNVLYFLHGGGENEDLLFGGPGQSRELMKIIDNMIAKGDIEPMIVVTPTFYGGKNDVAVFHEELVNDIIPLVETKYNTYAKSGSKEDIKASRAHRAFGGFSMGSVTTWYTFANALDYIKYYIPLSGDSWVIEQRGGGLKPKETAEFLANAAKKSGYTPKDYYIFAATGDLDIAYPNLKPQADEMKKLTDAFIYSSNTDKGNFYFMVAEGGTHHWNWQNQYIYGILPDLFKG